MSSKAERADAARRYAGLKMLQLPDELKYSTWERFKNSVVGGGGALFIVIGIVALPILWALFILGLLDAAHDLVHGLFK